MKKSIIDFNSEEINYTLKLLKNNTNIKSIRKKTGLQRNEILFLADHFHIDYDLETNLPCYTFNDNTIGIISDTHIGSKFENRKYIDLATNYFIKNNIHKVINCGDMFQAIIEPMKYGLQRQINVGLKEYPYSKVLTNYVLGGNHEFHFMERDEELFYYLFTRKDMKFLGLKEAYINWKNKLIKIEHPITKYFINLPNIEPNMTFDGHHHFFAVKKGHIYLSTLSDDIKKPNEKPSFLEATLDNNYLYVEKIEVSKKIDNKKLVYKKKI